VVCILLLFFQEDHVMFYFQRLAETKDKLAAMGASYTGRPEYMDKLAIRLNAMDLLTAASKTKKSAGEIGSQLFRIAQLAHDRHYKALGVVEGLSPVNRIKTLRSMVAKRILTHPESQFLSSGTGMKLQAVAPKPFTFKNPGKLYDAISKSNAHDALIYEPAFHRMADMSRNYVQARSALETFNKEFLGKPDGLSRMARIFS